MASSDRAGKKSGSAKRATTPQSLNSAQAAEEINRIAERAGKRIIDLYEKMPRAGNTVKGVFDDRALPCLIPPSPSPARGCSTKSVTATTDRGTSISTPPDSTLPPETPPPPVQDSSSRASKRTAKKKKRQQQRQQESDSDGVRTALSPGPETYYPGKKGLLQLKPNETVYREVTEGRKVLVVREVDDHRGDIRIKSADDPRPRLLELLRNSQREPVPRSSSRNFSLTTMPRIDEPLPQRGSPGPDKMPKGWGIDATISILDATGKRHQLKISAMSRSDSAATTVIVQDRPVTFGHGKSKYPEEMSLQ